MRDEFSSGDEVSRFLGVGRGKGRRRTFDLERLTDRGGSNGLQSEIHDTRHRRVPIIGSSYHNYRHARLLNLTDGGDLCRSLYILAGNGSKAYLIRLYYVIIGFDSEPWIG